MKIRVVFNENDPRQFQYIDFIKEKFPELLIEKNPDMIYAVGGDGAMLHAHENFYSPDVLFFGKGMGTLNFIMNNFENDVHVIESIIDDSIKLHTIKTHRMDIKIIKKNGETISKKAINDIVIGNNIMDWHEFFVNSEGGSFLNFQYKGMGLCVSTPLGSTAFNLNNGGTVLPVDTDLWSLTSVVGSRRINEIMTPQTLDIEINSERHSPQLFIDGTTTTLELEKGDQIQMKHSNDEFNLAFIDPASFHKKRMKLVQNKR